MFNKATSSIQVAVPWFTDDVLIEKLIQKASKVHVELLLSADKTNVLKYEWFKKLQQAGAKVQKIGGKHIFDSDPFMHTKLIIIDKNIAWGGSYNFTQNARSNYEMFDEYARVTKSLSNFTNWFSDSISLFKGWENPDQLKQEVLEEFEANEKRIKLYQSKILSEIDAHKHSLVAEEIKKTSLRETAQNLVTGTAKVTSVGTISTQTAGISMPQHRNYGGISFSRFSGQKLRNSFGLAHYQKHFIEKNYDFLKCRIENDTLICVGEVQPENCEKYKIRIDFRAGHYPKVFIISPQIRYCSEIHVYNDQSLCLFYPPDMKWKDTTQIANYTIPWTIEWIVLYELWQLTGKWEGAEVSHLKTTNGYGN